MPKDDVPLPWEQAQERPAERLYDELPLDPPDAGGEMPVVEQPKRPPKPFLREN